MKRNFTKKWVVFFRLHAADEAVDFVLQDAAEDRGDYGAFTLRTDVWTVGVRVRQEGKQLGMEPVEKVSHKLVSVLLLVPPELQVKSGQYIL